VVVQAAPGAALEVVEAVQRFITRCTLLELLVRLLADPARLDRGRQRLQRRLGGEVREIVLVLARGAMLADQPDLLARQMPASPELVALGWAYP
jgi:hypothetical protein